MSWKTNNRWNLKMPESLPRLKPSPIPALHPVPEHSTDARLQEVYEDTKSVLQVPWMGVVTMAFAHYPTFYGALWGGLRDLAGSREFVEACHALRTCAEDGARQLSPSPVLSSLSELKYAEREIDEIRQMIEVFSHGNMPYLMLATAARLLLEGHELGGASTVSPIQGRHGPSMERRLSLIEAHHADAPTRAIYEDIKATLGLPFVNTDYRALARWPTYFSIAWNDLRGKVATPAYEPAVQSVHDFAVDKMRRLPNPGGLTAKLLQKAAAQDASLEEITSVVRLFQWVLPGLATNVAYFRAQL